MFSWCDVNTPRGLNLFFFLILLFSSFWTSRGNRCRPFSPRFLPSFFYRAQGSATPLLVDFSSSVANSRVHVFRKSICAQEKIPTNLYEYALGGARTHETDLHQARGQPDMPPGRPVHIYYGSTSQDPVCAMRQTIYSISTTAVDVGNDSCTAKTRASGSRRMRVSRQLVLFFNGL